MESPPVTPGTLAPTSRTGQDVPPPVAPGTLAPTSWTVTPTPTAAPGGSDAAEHTPHVAAATTGQTSAAGATASQVAMVSVLAVAAVAVVGALVARKLYVAQTPSDASLADDASSIAQTSLAPSEADPVASDMVNIEL